MSFKIEFEQVKWIARSPSLVEDHEPIINNLTIKYLNALPSLIINFFGLYTSLSVIYFQLRCIKQKLSVKKKKRNYKYG